MNLQNEGAKKRPKLSLSFGGRQRTVAAIAADRPTDLTNHELRRIVASMVD